jgi:hypothetical protein
VLQFARPGLGQASDPFLDEGEGGAERGNIDVRPIVNARSPYVFPQPTAAAWNTTPVNLCGAGLSCRLDRFACRGEQGLRRAENPVHQRLDLQTAHRIDLHALLFGCGEKFRILEPGVEWSA